MIGFFIFSLIFWLHWLCDFVLQADWMAKGKSSSNRILTIHVGLYTIPWMIVFGPTYGIVNGMLHWITDYFTSRKTKQLWAEQRVHDFFVVIGLDQAIHMTCLVATLPLAKLWWFHLIGG